MLVQSDTLQLWRLRFWKEKIPQTRLRTVPTTKQFWCQATQLSCPLHILNFTSTWFYTFLRVSLIFLWWLDSSFFDPHIHLITGIRWWLKVGTAWAMLG
jgi:hypothetical protein